MSQLQATKTQQLHPEPKNINRWNNISSDEDEDDSDHQSVQQKKEEAPVQPVVTEAVKENKEVKQDGKKKDVNIVPFDAKKKFRGGEFSNLKTVKGGFKAEKLQKKKFHLDTVRNPFAFGDDSDSESEKEEQTNAQQSTPAVDVSPAVEQSKPVEVAEPQKKVKKSKKQQEKEQLQALLKQLNADKEDTKQQGEKKKKKKKAKKAEGQAKQEQIAEQKPVEKEKTQQPKAEEFKVSKQFTHLSREALDELMKKKAEAAKATGKKSGKASIANVAKKAIEERDAKNKTKKVYVDL